MGEKPLSDVSVFFFALPRSAESSPSRRQMSSESTCFRCIFRVRIVAGVHEHDDMNRQMKRWLQTCRIVCSCRPSRIGCLRSAPAVIHPPDPRELGASATNFEPRSKICPVRLFELLTVHVHVGRAVPIRTFVAAHWAGSEKEGNVNLLSVRCPEDERFGIRYRGSHCW